MAIAGQAGGEAFEGPTTRAFLGLRPSELTPCPAGRHDMWPRPSALALLDRIRQGLLYDRLELSSLAPGETGPVSECPGAHPVQNFPRTWAVMPGLHAGASVAGSIMNT